MCDEEDGTIILEMCKQISILLSTTLSPLFEFICKTLTVAVLFRNPERSASNATE